MDITSSNKLFADLRLVDRELEREIKRLDLFKREGNRWRQWIIVVTAQTSSGWFQNLCKDCDGLCLVAGQNCAVVYHGDRNSAFVEEFGQYGNSV